MKIETHNVNDIKVAEITSDNIIINSAQDGLDLLGNLYYQDFDKLIIFAGLANPDFLVEIDAIAFIPEE